MKAKLKYINLFEQFNDIQYPDLNSEDVQKFLNNNISCTVIYPNYNDDNSHCFTSNIENNYKVITYNPYEKPYGEDDGDDGDDWNNLESNYDEIDLTFKNIKETKWSDTPIGKFRKFNIIGGYDSFNFSIVHNKNLSEIDNLKLEPDNINSLNLYILNNPVLEYVDVYDNIYHLGLKDNPILWNVTLHSHEDSTPTDLSVKNCPYIFLSTILNEYQKIYGYVGNSFTFEWISYDNNGILIDGNHNLNLDSYLINLAVDEILNIKDFSDDVYNLLIPIFIEFISKNHKSIKLKSNEALITLCKIIIDKNGIEYIKQKHIYDMIPDDVRYLINHEYANTGARSIAKMTTGRYLGMF